MSTTVSDTHSGLLGRTFDWIRERARRTQDVANMTPADLDLMASDLGITQADLLDVLPRAADDSRLMDQMLVARGLDPVEVRRNLGALVRNMELVCTRCRATGTCRRDLLHGTAEEHCHEYCGNAETIDDILESRSHG